MRYIINKFFFLLKAFFIYLGFGMYIFPGSMLVNAQEVNTIIADSNLIYSIINDSIAENEIIAPSNFESLNSSDTSHFLNKDTSIMSLKVPAITALNLKGTIVHEGSEVKGASVSLFEGNSEIKKISTKSPGRFSFDLVNDRHYSIVIEKEGFEKVLISVNTTLPPSDKKYPRFIFDFEIQLIESIKSKNKFIFDFPFALICYRPDQRVFNFNPNYTTFIKNEIDEVRERLKERPSVE